MKPGAGKWLYQLLTAEARQRTEEGCDSSSVQDVLNGVSEDSKPSDIDSAYDRMMELPISNDFPFTEPSELEEIKKLSPGFERDCKAEVSDIENRMLGAWLGRCAGCALGKPVERANYMQGKDGIQGWQGIRIYLKKADAWPLTTYIPDIGLVDGIWDLGCPDSTRDKIRFMETDDDIRYTVLGVHILQNHGSDFTSIDVANAWFQMLPLGQTFTAERQAYRNFADLAEVGMLNLENLDWVRMYRNPYREWIGAQIRADGWAYCAAGDPARAAEYSYRDAALSHVKNGIYGEMLFAAAISAGFTSRTPLEALETGLEFIPSTSRLYSDVREAIELGANASGIDELHSELWRRWGHYDGVHTNNNACLVAAAVSHAADDYEKLIVTAVTGGWDTDCNGATAGSLWGAVYGAKAIPEKWTSPLNDLLYAAIPGYHPIAISEMASKSVETARKLGAET